MGLLQIEKFSHKASNSIFTFVTNDFGFYRDN